MHASADVYKFTSAEVWLAIQSHKKHDDMQPDFHFTGTKHKLLSTMLQTGSTIDNAYLLTESMMDEHGPQHVSNQ